MIVEGARCRLEGWDARVGETEGQPEKHSASHQQHSPYLLPPGYSDYLFFGRQHLTYHSQETRFLKEHRRLLHDSLVTPRTIAKSIFEQNIDSPEKLMSILVASWRACTIFWDQVQTPDSTTEIQDIQEFPYVFKLLYSCKYEFHYYITVIALFLLLRYDKSKRSQK